MSVSKDTEEWLRDHAWRTRRSVSETLRDMVEAVRKEADNPHSRLLSENQPRDTTTG